MTLADRLLAVRTAGNLNFSDLHRWFNRPYPTVRSWAVGYCEPTTGPEREATLARLEVLENLVKSPPFPVPPKITPQEHAAWFQRLIHAHDSGVHARHFAE